VSLPVSFRSLRAVDLTPNRDLRHQPDGETNGEAIHADANGNSNGNENGSGVDEANGDDDEGEPEGWWDEDDLALANHTVSANDLTSTLHICSYSLISFRADGVSVSAGAAGAPPSLT
jgi:hypothetical protein